MDMKDKNKDDLLKIIKEKKEALRNFRFGIAGTKIRNVKEGRSLKKDIARAETRLKEISNK